MKALLQRVSQAEVEVSGEGKSSIGKGLVVFLGIAREDGLEAADLLSKRVLGYRIFEDAEEKMNLSVQDIQGELLVVSQFTLCADTRKGRRPSFDPAAAPEQAQPLYDRFVQSTRSSGLKVETGRFGAAMRVKIMNEGPATFLLEAP